MALRKKQIYRIVYICLFLLLISTYVVITIFRPLNTLKPINGNNLTKSFATSPLNINWPANSEAAISVNGYSFVNSKDTYSPTPTASVAKLITALMVLQKFPLAKGQQGNTFTITQKEMDIYYNYYSKNGSTSPFRLGEQINEYQLLQSMLIPSSNNAADSLAIWAYGSLSNYAQNANQFLKFNGINNTTVGSDASGYSPDTVSTPTDLLKIASLVAKEPVLMEIVGQKEALIPVGGIMYNYNSLLGKDGINGMKTGNNDETGGVLVTSSDININGKDITLLTSVMKATSLSAAITKNYDIVKQFRNNFSGSSEIIPFIKNANYYVIPWNKQKIELSIENIPDLQSLNSTDIKVSLSIDNISYKAKKGDEVGSLKITSSVPNVTETIKIYLASTPKSPSNFWLLTHPR